MLVSIFITCMIAESIMSDQVTNGWEEKNGECTTDGACQIEYDVDLLDHDSQRQARDVQDNCMPEKGII